MLEALTKYAEFSGRSRRREYWLFFLFTIIANMVAGVLDVATGTGAISAIVAIVLIVPSIAVLVRRLHDTNRSGWWALLILLPILGGLILLIFCIFKGTQGSNRFGPDPLGVGNNRASDFDATF